MTKFSEANLFGVTVRESANDGSDFTNPDADYRRLFLGEDGLLHLKDSAGTVTTPSAAGSGSITASGYTQTTARLLGRTTASTGAIEEISIGSGLSLSAGSLSASGGGSVKYPFDTNYFAETKPGSPDATYDDEFDDTSGMSGTVNSLAAKWNWRNQGSVTATFTKQGWLTLNLPSQASNNFRGIDIAGFADGTYDAKLSMEFPIGTTNVSGQGGIALIDNTNGDFYIFSRLRDTATEYFGVQRWTNVTTFLANDILLAVAAGLTGVFLRVIKASTTLSFWFSTDGIGFSRLFSVTDAIGATRIGLLMNENNSSGLVKMHCDYFRKTA